MPQSFIKACPKILNKKKEKKSKLIKIVHGLFYSSVFSMYAVGTGRSEAATPGGLSISVNIESGTLF